MADGTPTTIRPTTTWNEWTSTEARALRGDLPCPECNGRGFDDPEHQRGRCPECKGRRIVLPRSTPEEAGADSLLDALTSLAEAVAYVDVVGVELSARSRLFVTELHAGLGGRLVKVLEKIEALQSDIKRAVAAEVRR
jgi:hypothetical protein